MHRVVRQSLQSIVTPMRKVLQKIEHRISPDVQPNSLSEKLYPTPAAALADCRNPEGYDNPDLSAYLIQKSAKYISTFPGAPVAVADHLGHSLLVSLLVAKSRGRLRAIDFGGGAGVPFALLRHLLEDSIEATWHVVEVPSLVEHAQRHLDVPGLVFSDDLDGSLDTLGQVDLIHTAGTLQYLDDPRMWLRKLVDIRAPFVFLGRSAFSEGNIDVIGIQRSRIRDHGPQVDIVDQPSGTIEYPFNYVRRRDIDAIMTDGGYTTVATFDSESGHRKINDEPISGGARLYRLSL